MTTTPATTPPAEEPAELAFVRSLASVLGCRAAALVTGAGPAASLAAAWWDEGADGPQAGEMLAAASRVTPGGDVVPDGDGGLTAAPLDPRGPGAEGALVVAWRPGTRPGERDLDMLRAFARMGALTLEGAAQREAAALAHDRTALLVDAGMVIAAGLDLRDILLRLADAARLVIGARYAALGVLDRSRTRLSDFLWSGLDEEEAAAIGERPTGKGILGALIRDARPLRLPRLADDARSTGFPPGHPPMTSFLGVPVVLGGEVIGNLYLTEKLGADAFTDEDEQLALTLAAQAAVAVETARRFEAEQRRVAELEGLQEVAAAMLRTLELDTLLPLVARRARRLTGADVVAVALAEEGGLTVRFADGADAQSLEGVALGAADDEGIAGELAARASTASCTVAWLTIGGHRVGALAACGPRRFDGDALRLLDTFSSQAAIAVANARTFAEERRRLLASAEIVAAHARERAAEEGLRRAIAAQEAERARIARELHDETGQVLTALAVQLISLEDHVAGDDGRERLAELRALISSAASSLRSLATELRPSGLSQHGLAAAIARHAERVREATGIPVDIELDGLPAGLAEEVQIAIYRVVQEALTNIARHSGAARASVLATHHRGRMRVVVEDDGTGFDPAAPTSRLGMVGMRERMDLIGGDLRVESAAGEGTAVIIELEVRS